MYTASGIAVASVCASLPRTVRVCARAQGGARVLMRQPVRACGYKSPEAPSHLEPCLDPWPLCLVDTFADDISQLLRGEGNPQADTDFKKPLVSFCRYGTTWYRAYTAVSDYIQSQRVNMRRGRRLNSLASVRPCESATVSIPAPCHREEDMSVYRTGCSLLMPDRHQIWCKRVPPDPALVNTNPAH